MVSPPTVSRKMHPMLFSASQYIQFEEDSECRSRGADGSCAVDKEDMLLDTDNLSGRENTVDTIRTTSIADGERLSCGGREAFNAEDSGPLQGSKNGDRLADSHTTRAGKMDMPSSDSHNATSQVESKLLQSANNEPTSSVAKTVASQESPLPDGDRSQSAEHVEEAGCAEASNKIHTNENGTGPNASVVAKAQNELCNKSRVVQKEIIATRTSASMPLPPLNDKFGALKAPNAHESVHIRAPSKNYETKCFEAVDARSGATSSVAMGKVTAKRVDKSIVEKPSAPIRKKTAPYPTSVRNSMDVSILEMLHIGMESSNHDKNVFDSLLANSDSASTDEVAEGGSIDNVKLSDSTVPVPYSNDEPTGPSDFGQNLSTSQVPPDGEDANGTKKVCIDFDVAASMDPSPEKAESILPSTNQSQALDGNVADGIGNLSDLEEKSNPSHDKDCRPLVRMDSVGKCSATSLVYDFQIVPHSPSSESLNSRRNIRELHQDTQDTDDDGSQKSTSSQPSIDCTDGAQDEDLIGEMCSVNAPHECCNSITENKCNVVIAEDAKEKKSKARPTDHNSSKVSSHMRESERTNKDKSSQLDLLVGSIPDHVPSRELVSIADAFKSPVWEFSAVDTTTGTKRKSNDASIGATKSNESSKRHKNSSSKKSKAKKLSRKTLLTDSTSNKQKQRRSRKRKRKMIDIPLTVILTQNQDEGSILASPRLKSRSRPTRRKVIKETGLSHSQSASSKIESEAKKGAGRSSPQMFLSPSDSCSKRSRCY